MSGRSLGVGRASTGCDTVDVSPSFDPAGVAVESCNCTPTSGTPDTMFTLTVTVANPNDQAANADVGFFADGLPNGPGVGRINGISIAPNGTVTEQVTFVPNQTQEIVDTVGQDAGWTSLIEGIVIPGSVSPIQGDVAQRRSGFGLSGSSRRGGAAMTDGGCSTCGGSAATPMVVTGGMDQRTLAVTLAGIGSGVAVGAFMR